MRNGDRPRIREDGNECEDCDRQAARGVDLGGLRGPSQQDDRRDHAGAVDEDSRVERAPFSQSPPSEAPDSGQ